MSSYLRGIAYGSIHAFTVHIHFSYASLFFAYGVQANQFFLLRTILKFSSIRALLVILSNYKIADIYYSRAQTYRCGPKTQKEYDVYNSAL